MNFVQSFYGWEWRGWAALVAMAVASLFMLVLFSRASAKTGSDKNNVIHLQRAYTPEMFAGVLRSWSTAAGAKPEAVGIMKRENIIKLDLIFPVVYALALALSYAALSGRRQPTALDFVLFLTPFVAGLFDLVENSIHLYLLRGVNTAADVEAAVKAGTFRPSPVFAASAFAHAKYVLLLVSGAALVWGVIQCLRAR